jgi:myosin-crossreactive antigen
MSFIFKNEEFDKLFQKILLDLETYLEEHEIKLEDDTTVEDIVMWQRNRIGEYLVHPSDKWPKNIEPKVLAIILKHNPTI